MKCLLVRFPRCRGIQKGELELGCVLAASLDSTVISGIFSPDGGIVRGNSENNVHVNHREPCYDFHCQECMDCIMISYLFPF